MELAVSLTRCGVLLRVESLKAFFYAGIVDAQELVLCSGHVNEIRLALGAFLIEKLVHWLVLWSFSQICTDNLVQRFPQVRRAALGCWSAFCVMFAGLVYGRINTGEAHDRTAAGKTAYIADLSMSCVAVVSPTPYMVRTVSYSGSCCASCVISRAKPPVSSYPQEAAVPLW